MDNNGFVYITVYGLVCVLIIVSYGTYRCQQATEFVDPLTKSAFSKSHALSSYLDGWGISHFAFFFLLGYLYPGVNYVLYSFCLGVLWEIFEYTIKDKPFYLSRCNYKTGDGRTWWYGRWQDIVMNSLGLLAGAGVANLLFKIQSITPR